METPNYRMTHPLVLGAAASVMVASLVGAAAIGGLLPNARSDKTEAPAPKSAPVADSTRQDAPRLAAHEAGCASCGTVESIHAVELKGNALERKVSKRYSYRIKVRMDDGTFRAVSQIDAPALEAGERVRVRDGAVIALS